MKNIKNSCLLAVWLTVCIGWLGALSGSTLAAVEDAVLDKEIEAVGTYLMTTVPQPQVGSVGGEWCVLGLARANHGASEYFDDYRQAARRTLRETAGVLHPRKYTEYARVTLALTALGENPLDFAGFDVVSPLTDTKKVLIQGTSGAIWALLALDSKEYPDSGAREIYLDEILKAARADGGYSLAPSLPSNVDLTAMALLALAPYAEKNQAVKAAVESGWRFLSENQNADGSYSDAGLPNAESTAQVLVALAAYGISERDERFVKNGKTVTDALFLFRCGDGAFRHTLGETTANAMATEQGFYALAALKRYRSGQRSLFDLRDARENPTATAGAGQPATGLAGKMDAIHPRPILFPGKTFEDLADASARKHIEALAARGVLNGKSEGQFDPSGLVTRAEFCAMILRALGLEPVDTQAVFTDVSQDDWFSADVNTAFFYGIVKGVSATEFDPNGCITREQACVMLERAARLCGIDTAVSEMSAQNALAVFTDYRLMNAWARNAAAFCASCGIFSPPTAEFDPTKFLTRAEIADMIFQLLSLGDLL